MPLFSVSCHSEQPNLIRQICQINNQRPRKSPFPNSKAISHSDGHCQRAPSQVIAVVFASEVSIAHFHTGNHIAIKEVLCSPSDNCTPGMALFFKPVKKREADSRASLAVALGKMVFESPMHIPKVIRIVFIIASDPRAPPVCLKAAVPMGRSNKLLHWLWNMMPKMGRVAGCNMLCLIGITSYRNQFQGCPAKAKREADSNISVGHPLPYKRGAGFQFYDLLSSRTDSRNRWTAGALG